MMINQKLLLYIFFFMEHSSRRVSKDKKLQYFLTQIPKDDAKVRFQSYDISTPVDTFKYVESAPFESVILTNSKTSIRNGEGKRMKAFGINQLKSILKSSKEMASCKKSVNVNVQTPTTSKYFRISINDELKQNTENSERAYEIPNSKNEPFTSSISKFLQRTLTQTFQQKQYKQNLKESTKNMKRIQRRRKCRIITQVQFEDQCTKYIESKQKQQTDELFREMNRLMILNQKRKDPNNYYQKIRKSALKKIDYMSTNQKYYDDAEIKHLFSVVENCNILIHKRSCNEKQKENFNRRMKTERAGNKDNDRNNIFNLTAKKEIDEDQPLNRTSISSNDLFQLQKMDLKESKLVNKFSTSKTVKRIQKQKVNMNKRIINIVQVCEKQRKMLEQVKNGMKVFEFYCNKIDTGFAHKGKRLNNFLNGDDQG